MAKSKRPIDQSNEQDAPVSSDNEPMVIPEPDRPVTENAATDEILSASDIPEDNEVRMSEPVETAPTTDEPVSAAAVREIRVERKGGFVPMALGGVVAAVAGYALATFSPILPVAQDDPRISALESQTNAFSDRLAQIEKTPAPPQPDLTEIETRLAALESAPTSGAEPQDLSAITDALSQLDTRLSAIESMPTDGTSASNPAMAAALDSLRAEVEAIKGQGADAAASIQQMVADAEARVADAEARAADLKAEAEAVARKSLETAAMGHVMAALESGAPFAASLQDLESANIPAELSRFAETGAPTLANLEEAFIPAARVALEQSRRATVGEGMGDRFAAFLQNATGARSLAPREGDDPDAVLSRTEAAVQSGDLKGAIVEIQTLPEEGQAALADWVALAQSRIDAVAAAETLRAAISG